MDEDIKLPDELAWVLPKIKSLETPPPALSGDVYFNGFDFGSLSALRMVVKSFKLQPTKSLESESKSDVKESK